MKDLSVCEEAQWELINTLEKEDFSPRDIDRLKERFPDCSDFIQEQYAMWSSLDEIQVPEPSAAMDAGFYRTLSSYSQVNNQPFVLTRMANYLDRQVMSWSSVTRWTGVAALFIVGLFAGRFLLGVNTPASIKNEIVHHPSSEEASTTFVGYNAEANTAERLKEIQEVRNQPAGNHKIYEALNHALLNDKNVNVRLSAIESLVHFADDPEVRKYLIHAIPRQRSPLVQVALADAMILLHEKGARDAWEELLQSDDVQHDVKDYVEESLDKLY